MRESRLESGWRQFRRPALRACQGQSVVDGLAPSCNRAGYRSRDGPGRSIARLLADSRRPIGRRCNVGSRRVRNSATDSSRKRTESPWRARTAARLASNAEDQNQERTKRQRVASVCRPHQTLARYADCDRQRAEGDQQESHALTLRHAEGRGMHSRAMPAIHTRRGVRSKKSAGRNRRKTGPNWCEKLSKRPGSMESGTMASSRLSGRRRQWSFDGVENLIEAGAAENLAEKRKNGIACMNIRPQIPADAYRDSGRDVDKRKPQPTRPFESRFARPAIAGSQSQSRRRADRPGQVPGILPPRRDLRISLR